MTPLIRGMVIDVSFDPPLGSETGKTCPCVIVTNNVYNERTSIIQVVPITGWSEKKSRIMTNVVISPGARNGLTKHSIADCLQTRPVDHRCRLVQIRGELTLEEMRQIDTALRVVFSLK